MTPPRDGRSSRTRACGRSSTCGTVDVALFGIGGPAWSAAQLGESLERDLDAAGASARSSWRHSISRGVSCARRSRAGTPSTPAFSGASRRHRVASGESKVRPILGAAIGRLRTLVTDVATAEAVVALDDAGPR
jgi:DNA-binding transcriptional regulator LsrR (DeoR family)